MEQWTQAYVDSLPDTSFLSIAAGGAKDSEGKTTPRSLRQLPYADTDGKLNHAYLAKSLLRLDATPGITDDEKVAIRSQCQKLLDGDTTSDATDLSAVTEDMLSPVISPFELDASGTLPTRFPIFVTGDWPHSIKGNFKVTLDSLKQMKQKFDAGIGFPTKDGSTGLAVNFDHNRSGPAAAWVKGIELEADEANDKGTLYATNIQYSDLGEQAIRSGRYKCISPEGAFGYKNGALSALPSHLNLKEKLTNILTGFGFTNMPYLSEMAPVMCSAAADDGPMIFIKEEVKENGTMNLNAIVLKDNKDITAEERQLLSANKDELSADLLKKFELEAAVVDTLSAEDKELLAAVKSGKKKVVDDNDGDEDVSAADRQTLADIKSGKKKLVDASEKLDALSQDDRDTLDALQSGSKKLVDADMLSKLDKIPEFERIAEKFKYSEAEKFVHQQLSRGALKSDQEKPTITMLLSMEGDARKAFEDHLSALPSNDLLAAEIGHSQEVVVDVADELKQKTLDTLSKAKTAGETTLTYGQAQERLMRSDADLKARYEASKN